MGEYFTVSQDGNEYRYKDEDQTPNLFGPPAEIYTTYSPDNARHILDYVGRNYTVAVCSDIPVGCALNTSNALCIGESIKAQRTRCPDHGGFRHLNDLDILHFAAQAKWREPGFQFDKEYIAEVSNSAWLNCYPLNPFLDYLGLNRAYSFLCVSSWIDYRRFQMGMDPMAADESFSRYMMTDSGPGRDVYEAIKKDGTVKVLNDPNIIPGIRRWLLGVGCWVNSVKHPVLSRVHHRTLHMHRSKDKGEAEYKMTCDMTAMAVHYIYCHHRWLTSGGRFGFNPRAFFSASRDVAAGYMSAFPPGPTGVIV